MRSIYELWMEQSKDFFTTSEQHMQGIFTGKSKVNPEDHLAHIHVWLNAMKQQWQAAQTTHEQNEYWNGMTTICSDAADLMLEEWRRMVRDERPVKSIQELYQLWLNCCSEIYQHSLQSKEFQDHYGEFMNRAFRFWKNAVPTN